MSVSTRVDDLQILESPAAAELSDHIEILQQSPVVATESGVRLLPVLAVEAAILLAILMLAFFLTSGVV